MRAGTGSVFGSLALVLALGAASCARELGDSRGVQLPDVSVTDPVNPPGTGGGGSSAPRAYATDALIFNGLGVSTSDWQNTERIVRDEGLSYELANTAQLNAMSAEKLASFGVIIVPGGSGGTIYSNLTAATRLRVRKAVQEAGVGYVGFCAGAWVAVGPEATGNATAAYGMAVAPGAVLDYYYPPGKSNVTAMVDVIFAGGENRSLVWYGGPATPEWKGGVVARYDTGEPAISQIRSGKGFVVISGPHPEAPQGWRSAAGYDRDGLDYDIALAMIRAATTGEGMPVVK